MDSSKHIRNSIVELYNNTIGKSVDAKTLSYLVSTVSKGENSLANIAKTLVNTSEYVDRVKNMFSVAYYDMIGVDAKDTIFNEFWESHHKSNIVTGDDIEQFIRATPAFKQKCKALVQRTVGTHFTQHTLTNELLDKYSKKLASQPEYTVDSLVKDLELHFDPPTHEPLPCHDSEVKPTLMVTLTLDEERLSAFEDAFKRHMYVKEYFKYVVNPTNTCRENYFKDLAALKDTHLSNFNRMCQIYKSYCNKELTEYDYVNQFLLLIDNENFFEQVISDILQTNDFKSAMCVVLTDYYKKIYDLPIDESDLEYIFDKVKGKRMHLYDERIVETLKEFKTQTDIMIENIFNTYEHVLERQPDSFEIEQQLAHYRKNLDMGFNQLNTVLSTELSGTLEFHDIIKKHIKDLFYEKTTTNLSPSRLYAILQQLLASGDITIHNLDQRILLLLFP